MSGNDLNSSIGQVSADGQFRWDGQQWVPIASGSREATPWTRPMQLATAALFATSTVVSVISTFVFVNRDSMLQAIQAQGTSIPQGTSVDTVVNIAIGVTIGTVIFIGLLYLVAAVGSYLGWRWMFWAALVLAGFGGLGALTNLGNLAHPANSPVPVAGILLDELFGIADLALFVWLLLGVIKFGPWAMKRPGR
jgi:hypothetical protein